MAITPYFPGVVIGYLPSVFGFSNTAANATNATGTWPAFGFVLPEDKTLNSVLFRCNTKTGTVASTDISVEVYSATSAGNPNASLAASTTISPAVASSTNCSATGFSQALTANTQYFIVFKNTNGTPASNNVSISSGSNVYPFFAQGGNISSTTITYGWHKRGSTDSGATWVGTATASSMAVRLDFSDGTYAGTGLATTLQSDVAANSTYLTNESGVLFTLPSNVTMKVHTIGMSVRKVGSPTGLLTFKLYAGSGGSALAETGTIDPAALSTTGALTTSSFVSGGVASSQTLTGGSTYRIVMRDAAGNSDSTSNYYASPSITIENSAASKSLVPYNIKLTRTTDGTVGNPAWTDTDTTFQPFVAIGLPGGEFVSSGGASTVYVF